MNWVTIPLFVTALVLLLFLERWFHRHLQGVALLLVNDTEVATFLYALPLLPGVILHEVSHALAARIIGARVGRISVLPAREGDRIQLGFVPVEATGPLGTAVIGLAPLLMGCLVLILIGHLRLGLDTLGSALAAGDWTAILAGLDQVLHSRDVWIWIYLTFAISNTMFPSRSDLRAWPVIAGILLAAILLAALLGLGFALTGTLRWLTIACTLTLLLDLPFALLTVALERGLERWRGAKVEYR